MSDQIGINLKKEVKIVLTKRKLNNLCVQAAAILDVSQSTQSLFSKGIMQKTLKRAFAIADQVDDNHTLDAWVFSSRAAEAEGVTPDNVDTYIDREVVGSKNKDIQSTLWGGTSYCPPIEKLVEYYKVEDSQTVLKKATGMFGKLKSMFGVAPTTIQQPTSTIKTKLTPPDMPAFAMIFTDGDNGDKSQTTQFLQQYEDSTVFFQFVGVGNERFAYLKEISAKFKNVDFTDISDLDSIPSDKMYEKLISPKFAGWVQNVAPHCITN